MSESEEKPSAWSIMVPWAIVAAFILAIVLPAKWPRSLAPACIKNLEQIDAAAKQFASEHHSTNGAPIKYPNDLTPYIQLNGKGEVPPCPAGGAYRISKVGEAPTCSLGTSVTPAHVLP